MECEGLHGTFQLFSGCVGVVRRLCLQLQTSRISHITPNSLCIIAAGWNLREDDTITIA